MSEARIELRLENVKKSFGGVHALKGVNLEVKAGEVHALLGENGAGKSTLMAVAAGVLEADSGTVEIGGERLAIPTPSAAQALGVGVVYQHPAIADDLTVVENMLLAPIPAEDRPSFRDGADWARSQLEELGASIDPYRRVSELTAAQHQLIEIAKALALKPKVLVLDEPTAALGASEVRHLFEQVRRIRSKGTAVVYISHRIPEVTEIADRLTVLRDGRYRGTFDVADVTEDEILELIVGREISAVFPEKSQNGAGPSVLAVKGFSGQGFHDVSMQVKSGEIVGLAGVIGNGQREVIRSLAGLVDSQGTVEINGEPANLSSPDRARKEGVSYIPGDRQREGLFDSLSVRENTVANSLPSFARGPFVGSDLERKGVKAELEALTVKAESPEVGVVTLSGGNQQKVVFARSLLSEPSVMLCDEPTQGVDVGARVELYRLMRRLADEGKAVVVCSSDALELEGLCDRVLIMSRGQVVATLEGDDVTEEKITGAAVKSSGNRPDEAVPEPEVTKVAGEQGRIARFLGGDNVATPVIALAILAVAIFTYTQDPEFLSSFNVSNLLLLSTALILVSLGQLFTLLTAGVDLSVGPMMGLGLVILTTFATDDKGLGGFLLGFGLLLLAGIIVGTLNGSLIRVAKINPVIATLATFIAIQGVALTINPIPDGLLSRDVFDVFSTTVGGTIPVMFIVVVAITVVLQLMLRRSRYGMSLRAVGSSEPASLRIGLKVGWTVFSAYVVCAVFAALAAIMLAVQIGTGDATAGQNYTLQSIAAVVIGGASIYGGRGSFMGAFLGALLLTEIINALPFLQLDDAWQYWIPGGIILIAAAVYARASRARTDPSVEPA
jgi:ribose transport system ATP-binding protein